MATGRELEAKRRIKANVSTNTVELAALTTRVAALETSLEAILQHLSLVGVPNVESTVTLYPPTVA